MRGWLKSPWKSLRFPPECWAGYLLGTQTLLVQERVKRVVCSKCKQCGIFAAPHTGLLWIGHRLGFGTGFKGTYVLSSGTGALRSPSWTCKHSKEWAARRWVTTGPAPSRDMHTDASSLTTLDFLQAYCGVNSLGKNVVPAWSGSGLGLL